MKHYFVFNPKAGEKSKSDEILKTIKPFINDIDTFLYFTKAHKDATAYVTKIIQANPEEKLHFIACGGDGTMNEVFTPCVNKDNVYVSLLPCGSGNDFIKCFNFKDAKEIMSIDVKQAKKIDVLKVNDYYSFNMLNFGFDTTVACKVQEDRDNSGHGNNLAYLKGVIYALSKSLHYKGQIIADGKQLNQNSEFLLCTCANGQYVGSMFRCSPLAILDDGYMDVCLVKPLSRFKFITLVSAYAKGEHLKDPKFKKYINYTRAKKVEIHTSANFAYSLDGEIIRGENIIVELKEKALNILMK